MKEVKEILGEAEEAMEMAIMYLDEQFAHIRAGKANTRILDGIRVDSYGSMVPINNVAAVTTPDARTIAIKPMLASLQDDARYKSLLVNLQHHLRLQEGN